MSKWLRRRLKPPDEVEGGAQVATHKRWAKTRRILHAVLPLLKSAVDDIPVPGPKAAVNLANDYIRRSSIKQENVLVQSDLIRQIDDDVVVLNEARIERSLGELATAPIRVTSVAKVDSTLMAEVTRDELAVEADKLSRVENVLHTRMLVSVQTSQVDFTSRLDAITHTQSRESELASGDRQALRDITSKLDSIAHTQSMESTRLAIDEEPPALRAILSKLDTITHIQPGDSELTVDDRQALRKELLFWKTFALCSPTQKRVAPPHLADDLSAEVLSSPAGLRRHGLPGEVIGLVGWDDKMTHWMQSR
ncbi:hypothetical protein BKA62DRAFT_770240 [Auriculariales sp. MPI-PUGE-AT-0066]|nr:hypothetical protein BKA62DRAFT_770240 [Auriculariales sp. MPI-PUGE-AT-0066]